MQIEKLIAQLSEELELEPGTLQPKTSFKDIEEWSSMHALILIALVDTEYNVTLNGEDLKTIKTAEDLYNLIVSRKR